MGYEMSLYLRVQPAEKFTEVADAIEERFGIAFDDNEDGTGCPDGMRKWSDMDEDLRALTTDMPGVVISMQVDGEDGAEWIDHFQGGKSYTEGRPDWVPEPFDESKLK